MSEANRTNKGGELKETQSRKYLVFLLCRQGSREVTEVILRPQNIELPTSAAACTSLRVAGQPQAMFSWQSTALRSQSNGPRQARCEKKSPSHGRKAGHHLQGDTESKPRPAHGKPLLRAIFKTPSLSSKSQKVHLPRFPQTGCQVSGLWSQRRTATVPRKSRGFCATTPS